MSTTVAAQVTPAKVAPNYLNAEQGLKSWLLTQDHKRIAVAGKIAPYFVVILDWEPATAFRFRLVWPDFPPQRSPPYSC